MTAQWREPVERRARKRYWLRRALVAVERLKREPKVRAEAVDG